jgi:hypothetical protein
MAIYFFAMYVLGASLGPVGTGLVSDYFTFQAAGAAGAVEPLRFGELVLAEFRGLIGEPKGFDTRALEPFRAQGLRTAMYVVPALGTVLAVVLFAASRSVKADVARLHEWMQQPVTSPRA